ncbi:acyl carrier protein [Streptomyces boninensis]|uniref:acyl carrier protein n=1 Tax=Streptomyces boninensis TaxID=2039455 RepID=UPI003B21FEF8
MPDLPLSDTPYTSLAVLPEPPLRPPVPAPDVRALTTLDPAALRQELARYVQLELERALGPYAADGGPPSLAQLGSMKGLEVRQRIAEALGVDVSVQQVLLARSNDELAGHLAWHLLAASGTAAAG